MSKELLHTPEGVRDIYGLECERKLILEDKLHHKLNLYGYHDIQTPSFEFFDVFSREIGTIPSRELFKFFDREGNTLVLRPDFTPSVARSAAKYFMDETKPIRMCYMGNTFINQSSYQLRLKETTQLGAEFLGDSTVAADAEMISLTVELLKESGLKEFQVSIGQIDFFKGLLDEVQMDEDTESELRELISTKNLFGIEELLENLSMDDDTRYLFIHMPELFGGIDMLDKILVRVKNERALAAIDRLKAIYEILGMYGVDSYVTFDLGLVSKYNYYTGIIFQAYTYGTGEPIVKGGRYDKLLAQFGKSFAAIGFVVMVDRLMTVLERQKIEMSSAEMGILILAVPTALKNAIAMASELRAKNRKVELLTLSDGETPQDYVPHAEDQREDEIIVIDAAGRSENYKVCALKGEN